MRLDVVKFLIAECGASLQQDRFGLLPIHDAVENSHTEVRRYLQSQKLAVPQQSLQKRRRVDSVETLNTTTEARRWLVRVLLDLPRSLVVLV